MDAAPDKAASFMCLSNLPANEQDLDAMTDDAAARFRDKYGQAPEKIWIEKRNLWLGPIPPERQNRWHTTRR